MISRNIMAGSIISTMMRSRLEQTSGIQPSRDGMKNVPALYKCNKFMKKFMIYKITFEWCWKSLSLGQKFEICTCKNSKIAKTLPLQNIIQKFKIFSIAKILGNYENKTVCFLDYLIFNKDHIICSGMTLTS